MSLEPCQRTFCRSKFGSTEENDALRLVFRVMNFCDSFANLRASRKNRRAWGVREQSYGREVPELVQQTGRKQVGTSLAICLLMLKIRRLVDGESITFALSGRIEEQDLAQLRSLIEVEPRPIVLDLKEITLAGRDAVRFLAHCQQTGVRLRRCPVYLLGWIAAERVNAAT